MNLFAYEGGTLGKEITIKAKLMLQRFCQIFFLERVLINFLFEHQTKILNFKERV